MVVSDLFWLTYEQSQQQRPFFLKSHGKSRVGGWPAGVERHRVSRPPRAALVRWDSREGPAKTLYDRTERWRRAGVFTRLMKDLAAADAEPGTVMIGATFLEAHRTASSLRVEGAFAA